MDQAQMDAIIRTQVARAIEELSNEELAVVDVIEPEAPTSCTIRLAPERCREVEITVYSHSTAELVKHDPEDSANTWYSLLVDGRHYRLVMAKFTHGRPEITEVLNQALAEVQKTIAALASIPILIGQCDVCQATKQLHYNNVVGRWVCDLCDIAGMERLKQAIFG